jgi:hypothetical protein
MENVKSAILRLKLSIVDRNDRIVRFTISMIEGLNETIQSANFSL